MKILQANAEQNSTQSILIFTLGLLLILVICIIDYFTGYQLSFSIFYLIPIIWITWKLNKIFGLITSLLSTIAWLAADILADHTYSHFIIPYWNGVMRFGIFMTVTFIISSLKETLKREKLLSRVDYLTQTANLRSFMEALSSEKLRVERYHRPFTLAYVDLDNFKFVNDSYGHETGDNLLKKMAQIMQQHVRQIDIVGRLGGDEFGILLPETGIESATEVLKRLQGKLLSELSLKDFPVTVSIGSVTFSDVPETADEIIKMADDLMYEVKKSGKNGIRFEKAFS